MLAPHSAKVPMQKAGARKKGIKAVNSPALSSVILKGIAMDEVPELAVLLNRFPLQFIYLQKLITTKVMKVDYSYSAPFYKVVLTSLMHSSASILWIQHQPHGWVVLLGPRLEEKLKWALISAIECHELLSSIKKNTES